MKHQISRAISLYAPWVWAILHAGKDIENRSLRFPRRTGWVWLHASKFGASIWDMDYEAQEMIYTAKRAGYDKDAAGRLTLGMLQEMRGHILGAVEIVGHATETTSPWHVPGQLGLKLGKRFAIHNPVSARGALGFWAVPNDVLDELERQTPEWVFGEKDAE